MAMSVLTSYAVSGTCTPSTVRRSLVDLANLIPSLRSLTVSAIERYTVESPRRPPPPDGDAPVALGGDGGPPLTVVLWVIIPPSVTYKREG